MRPMKAVVLTEFGPPEVLRLQDIDQPLPRHGDVLIKVRATTVTAAESQMRRGRPLWGRVILGLRRPRRRFRVPGIEVSGEGVSVRRRTPVPRGRRGVRVHLLTMGACAEYVRMPESGSLTRKPENAETYDVIFDTVGKSSYAQCKPSLATHGRYVSTVGLWNYVLALRTSLTGGKQVVTGMSVNKNDALPFLRDLIEAGELTIAIDRRYALATIVEAHRYVETGHKRGNVVVSVP